MILEKTRTSDGTIVYSRADRKDLIMFCHCTNGEVEIPSRKFYPLKDMLCVHGIIEVTIVDKTKKKKTKRTKEKSGTDGHSYQGTLRICRYCFHSKRYIEKNSIKCPGTGHVRLLEDIIKGSE